MKIKNIIIATLLAISVYLGSIYKAWIGTGIRKDLFLFYDYKGGRLVSNILVDVNNMLTTSLILFLWYYFSATRLTSCSSRVAMASVTFSKSLPFKFLLINQ